MPNRTTTGILRHLARTDTGSDRDLLARFVAGRDDRAFAELVRRHGPLVLAACRRGTGNHHDADDGFQAVFLTLARRAAAIHNPDLLGHWLYQVAVRVAWRARRTAARRRAREVQVEDFPESGATPREPDDLGPVLDEELARLSPWHREALVLCDLQGLARADAAARLGVPLGTLASRLDAARKKLALALMRRGVTLAAAAVPGVLADLRAAAVPASLLDTACGLATGAVPRAILQLAHGGVMMRMATTIGLVAAALAVVGVGLSARPGDGQTPVAPPPRPVVDVAAPPKEVVLRAWEESLAGLKTGVGEGTYETWLPGGKAARFRVKVAHAGPRFRVELDLADPDATNPGMPWPTLIVYDGQTLAYRIGRPGERSVGGATMVPAPADAVFRNAAALFHFNPTRLQAASVDLPAMARNRPGFVFSYGPDGVAATDQFSERPRMHMTLRFPREAGYNLAASEFVREDTGYKQVGSATWARSNGAWYVSRVEEATHFPGGPTPTYKLAYARFEANVAVDPGLFRLPGLGVARGGRLLYRGLDGVVEEFTNDPPAEDRPGDTLLDGLRRLPRRDVAKQNE